MAKTIFSGRYTARANEPVVLFLIGMRVNNLLDVRRWIWVLRQMGPMLATLMAHKEKGLLHFETFFSHRGVVTIQYWRSFDELEHFARNPGDPHLQSWREFYQVVGSDPSSGVWHETYAIEPGAFEGIYVNMPRWGMAAATEHERVGPGRDAAKERLRAKV